MAYNMKDSRRNAPKESSQMSTARGPMKVKSDEAFSVGTWELESLEEEEAVDLRG